jgi:hypothetical protein
MIVFFQLFNQGLRYHGTSKVLRRKTYGKAPALTAADHYTETGAPVPGVDNGHFIGRFVFEFGFFFVFIVIFAGIVFGKGGIFTGRDYYRYVCAVAGD